MAGFLAILRPPIVNAFDGRIINLHPSLLPKFGGKGMYGMNVHKAVIEAKEKISGITIHQVTVKVDEGKIIKQESCPVLENDTPERLAERIHELEYMYYPDAIESLFC